jgi:Ca2+-binding EF-hand superfamily protein
MGNAQGGSDESRNRKAARKLRKKAEPLFGKYDTDNDGVLTEEQMEQFLEEIYALTGLPSDNTHKASRLNGT